MTGGGIWGREDDGASGGKRRSSVPVDGEASRASAGDADAALGFPAEVLYRALVFPQERLKLLEAAAVVVLEHAQEVLSGLKMQGECGK